MRVTWMPLCLTGANDGGVSNRDVCLLANKNATRALDGTQTFLAFVGLHTGLRAFAKWILQ